jgi:hypothetical protein
VVDARGSNISLSISALSTEAIAPDSDPRPPRVLEGSRARRSTSESIEQALETTEDLRPYRYAEEVPKAYPGQLAAPTKPKRLPQGSWLLPPKPNRLPQGSWLLPPKPNRLPQGSWLPPGNQKAMSGQLAASGKPKGYVGAAGCLLGNTTCAEPLPGETSGLRLLWEHYRSSAHRCSTGLRSCHNVPATLCEPRRWWSDPPYCLDPPDSSTFTSATSCSRPANRLFLISALRPITGMLLP